MTSRDFDSAFLAGHTVVAIIQATKNDHWAGDQTWNIARATARDESRVVLVDLCLGRPVLDDGAQRKGEEGIVDAFLYDVSLNRVAQQQELPGLHYIGVGTPTQQPEAVWSHARWERLASGFANEGALLLLFMAPAAIPFMVLKPDGMIVLDQHGTRSSKAMLPINAQWLDEVPILTTLVEPVPVGEPVPKVVSSRNPALVTNLAHDVRPVTEQETGAKKQKRVGPFRHRPRKRSKLRVGVGAVAIVVLGIIAVFRLNGNTAGEPSVSEASMGEASAGEPSAGAPADSIPSEPATVGADGRVARDADSLFYSVQVAAFDAWDRAMEYASGLERESLEAAVTPVRIGGRIWYRVILGALATAQLADTVLKTFWRDGLVEAGQGTILRTPHAFDLGSRQSVDLVREETQRLRGGGIPAYSVVTAGAVRILVGAFETPDQSGVAESLLIAAGLPATLISRTGITP